jgi:pimeloyl-ACP methyl ester carboxylesterase
MAKSTRLLKSIFRLFLPVVLLSVFTIAAASGWLVHVISEPGSATYLVTPEKYGQLSSRGAQVTEETWQNTDGSPSRGWILRGIPNSPAVILLHKYGADRSHVLNLGVKLNEATNFTVLMPDLRAHGPEPAIKKTSFGGCEASDVAASIAYLRSLKSPEDLTLVGKDIGIYGLELGALSAIIAAAGDPSVKAMVLDSVPQDSDHLVANSVASRFPFASTISSKFAQAGTYPFFYQDGCYRRDSTCEIAKTLADRRIMILGGPDAESFQDSSAKVARCFPANSSVESRTDLSPSGYSIFGASIDISSAYDQRVIDFLKQALTLP